MNEEIEYDGDYTAANLFHSPKRRLLRQVLNFVEP